MSSENLLHERCVDAWMRSRAGNADNDHAVELLLIGLRALWERAEPSLGEVTLTAIFQRAIHTAERRHEELVQLGLHVSERGVIDVAHPLPPRAELGGAVSCVLVEILRTLGSLTAGALTPALHASLAMASGDELHRIDRGSNGDGNGHTEQVDS
jgi:hypothetical protein